MKVSQAIYIVNKQAKEEADQKRTLLKENERLEKRLKKMTFALNTDDKERFLMTIKNN